MKVALKADLKADLMVEMMAVTMVGNLVWKEVEQMAVLLVATSADLLAERTVLRLDEMKAGCLVVLLVGSRVVV